MNKIQRFFGILFSLSVVLAACSDSGEGKITSDMLNYPGDEGPQPKISFDSMEYHFGRVAIGQSVDWTFRFKNTGEAPLVLSQVTTSCGCTTIKDWTNTPIAAGEEGFIVANLNTTNLSGQIHKTVYVLSNTLPAVNNLELKGEVVGKDVKDKSQQAVEMKRTY
jgi:Protein of unknown function (DUF1573)